MNADSLSGTVPSESSPVSPKPTEARDSRIAAGAVITVTWRPWPTISAACNPKMWALKSSRPLNGSIPNDLGLKVGQSSRIF
jgi:hypothetical protein